jgi:hypothetical protein
MDSLQAGLAYLNGQPKEIDHLQTFYSADGKRQLKWRVYAIAFDAFRLSRKHKGRKLSLSPFMNLRFTEQA